MKIHRQRRRLMKQRRRQIGFDRVAGSERHSRFMPAVARRAFRLPLNADCWPPGYGGGESSEPGA